MIYSILFYSILFYSILFYSILFYSMAYAVQTEDIYRDMAEDAATRYDFSEYTFDHPLYSDTNRKALGFFKDELNSVAMQQFVGLRPKCYAFLCTGKVSNNVLQHANLRVLNAA